MTTLPSHVQAYKMRRDVEEQNQVLKDLVSWEKQITKEDKNILNKKQSNDAMENESNKWMDDTMHSMKEKKAISIASKTMHISNITSSLTKEELEARERKKGNEWYSAGNYQNALKCYSQCLVIHSKCVLAYSNRSMTYIKLKDWIHAEKDANSALHLDNRHIKSYQRRSTARFHLGKIRSSLKDIKIALYLSKQRNESTKDDSYIHALYIDEKKIIKALNVAIHEAPKRKLHVKIKKNREYDAIRKENKHDQNSLNENAILRNENTTTIAHDEKKMLNNRKIKMKIPKTWYEFATSWKSCKCHDERIQYLSNIQAHKLKTLFEKGIEDVELLVDIINIASNIENGVDYLRSLSKIQKLNLNIMMFTDSQRQKVRECIRKCYANESDEYNDHEYIAQQFGC